MRYVLSALFLAAIAFVAGCGGKDAATQKTAPAPARGSAAPADVLPAGLMLAAAPEGAKDVAAAKKGVKEGDEVILRGRVGGDAKVFVGGTMLMMDASMQSCDMKPDDHCETPWDYCCDAPETIQQNRALIQVVGADGKPLKATLEGRISPLDMVIVKGKVQKADEKNFIVNASGIYIEQKFKKG